MAARHSNPLPVPRLPLIVSATVALLAGGCAVGPTYQTPLPTLPQAWRAAVPNGPGAPPASAGATAAADWWARFDDPAIATLVRQAEADSPALDKAAAAIASARAALASSGAAAWPAVTGSGSVTRARQTTGTIEPVVATTRSASLDASWELDLFGKLARGRQAAAARVEARSDDRASARVSLAAEVADDYVQYRACRMIEATYGDQFKSQQETARITAIAVRAGLSAPADDDLAQAGAASANATRIDQQTTCELLVKALVTLTGMPEPALRNTIDAPREALPAPAVFDVTRVPAGLLRQRPDIAAAERTLAAASADIGQAEADRYPNLSLAGSIGLAATSGTGALTSWSFGPSLALPIFDGGKRRAAVASAQAAYDSAHADYRSSVRSAVQEVEQALVQLYGASRRSEDAAQAAERYRRYFNATEINWRAGGASLLTLEEARRSSLTAETSLLALKRDQLRQYIALYKALGGGWEADARVSSNESSGRTP
jgi:outer membrane protein, multidrug efflux system